MSDPPIYAHSGTVLHRLDSANLDPVEIGPFGDLGGLSMLDIAVDEGGAMVGVTFDAIYTVDVDTGEAAMIAPFDDGTPNLTSLSFVPEDLDRPGGPERLVAATDDGRVFQVDRESGSISQIGDYGMSGTEPIGSNGDIVAVGGLGLFATVTIGVRPTDPDYLATIDPVTWSATPLGNGAGFDRIFGLAFTGGTIYGFVDGGAGGGTIIELDPVTGTGEMVSQGDIRWFGAGVTTRASIAN